MLETYSNLIKLFELNGESLETLEPTQSHPLFSVDSLNKEVVQNRQRTEKAGNMLRDVYRRIKAVKKGLDQWILEELKGGVADADDRSFVVAELEKNFKAKTKTQSNSQND